HRVEPGAADPEPRPRVEERARELADRRVRPARRRREVQVHAGRHVGADRVAEPGHQAAGARGVRGAGHAALTPPTGVAALWRPRPYDTASPVAALVCMPPPPR